MSRLPGITPDLGTGTGLVPPPARYCAAMPQENVETLKRTYVAWNEGDMDGMVAVLDPDFEYISTGLFPDTAPIYRGPEGWKSFYRELRGPWETLRIEPDEFREVGDQVVTNFTFDGRGRDGVEVHRRFGNVTTFQDGLILRIRAYADPRQGLEAVGLRRD